MENEKIEVKTHKVVCNGSDATHPKIFLEISEAGHVTCPYCSQVFVRVA